MIVYNVHPETFNEVLTEFRKLHEKHPEIDGHKKWGMSKALVRAMALADTAILKHSIGL